MSVSMQLTWDFQTLTRPRVLAIMSAAAQRPTAR
jgi:hypothetical protein